MVQKYKFFIKESAVTFRQDAVFGENDQQTCLDWIERLERMDLNEDMVIDLPDLNSFVQMVFTDLQHIIAAGGYVVNASGEVLMIHRRGHWDLPKGKQEPGEDIEETAMREVEEECGIGGLNIDSPPFSTFHLYEELGETIVKESVWYKMTTDDQSAPIPQSEEDIKEAIWTDMPIKEEVLNGAYPSIREVINHFSSPGSSETSGG